MSNALKISASAIVILSTSLIAPAFAAPEAGKISVTGSLGSALPAGGDVLKGDTATIPDLGAYNSALTGNSATITTSSRKFEKNYDGGIAGNVRLGYGLGNGMEAFGQVGYTQLRGGTSLYGSMNAPTLSATPLPVYAKLSDMRYTTIQGGLSKEFGDGALRPYIDGRLGVAINNDVRAQFTAPDAPAGGVTLPVTQLYKSGTAFAGGADIGVKYDVSPNTSLGLSAGVDYIGAREKGGSELAPAGFTQVADSKGIWTAPVMAQIGMKF
jgi:hypothetical protein